MKCDSFDLSKEDALLFLFPFTPFLLFLLLASFSPVYSQSSGDPDATLERALQYIQKKNTNLATDATIVLNRLQRKFDLELSDRMAVRIAGIPRDTGLRRSPYFPFFRLIDPEFEPGKLDPAAFPDFDGFTIPALYCDKWKAGGVPDARKIDSLVSVGGYWMTHAVLAWRWMSELECIKDTSGSYVRKMNMLNALREMVNSEGANSDAGIEALAMVAELGYAGTIKWEWITKMCLAQQPDGGWKEKPADGYSSDHTSILAVWVLLEYLNPAETDDSWFPGLKH